MLPLLLITRHLDLLQFRPSQLRKQPRVSKFLMGSMERESGKWWTIGLHGRSTFDSCDEFMEFLRGRLSVELTSLFIPWLVGEPQMAPWPLWYAQQTNSAGLWSFYEVSGSLLRLIWHEHQHPPLFHVSPGFATVRKRLPPTWLGQASPAPGSSLPSNNPVSTCGSSLLPVPCLSPTWGTHSFPLVALACLC